MTAPGPASTSGPPGRALLRVAGALTQLACGACLLIGTIGIVLVVQNRTGGLVPAAAWLLAAMAGLVFGGLIYRGGLVSMLIAAAINAGFGISLAVFDPDSLRRLLQILPASDVAAIGDGLHIAGFAVLGVAVICLVALPQGVRYAHWFRDAAAIRSATSTARGFPPPPVPARSSAYIIPAEDRPRSRRRFYLILGGAAIGIGAGFGVMVSSSRGGQTGQTGQTGQSVKTGQSAQSAKTGQNAKTGQSGKTGEAEHHGSGAAVPAGSGVGASQPAGSGAGASQPAADSAGRTPAAAASTPRTPAAIQLDIVTPADAAVAPEAQPHGGATARSPATVQDLVNAQHAAIARGDARSLAGLLAAGVFGVGALADEVAEGRAAVSAQLVRDLGDPPPGGFTVESGALAIGEDRGAAWIAEQLEVSAAGRSRSFAITELAAQLDGSWQIVALHWATPVDDATAEHLAILNRLPTPRPIVDRASGAGDLDPTVRAAFASCPAFADAYSERADAFNYGSGGERARGGATIKRIFSRLGAQLRIHDGARIVTGGAWDPAQRAAPRIAWAALNVDFTSKTRAATDLTQTFRVLAILIQEPAGWKIVQTQWSNGGPVH